MNFTALAFSAGYSEPRSASVRRARGKLRPEFEKDLAAVMPCVDRL